jgi:hypothetical protein
MFTSCLLQVSFKFTSSFLLVKWMIFGPVPDEHVPICADCGGAGVAGGGGGAGGAAGSAVGLPWDPPLGAAGGGAPQGPPPHAAVPRPQPACGTSKSNNMLRTSKLN